MRTSDLTAGISVVIPVYNGERTIEELVKNLEDVLTSFCSDFEIILVNDGGSDNSWSLVCDAAQRHDRILGIDLMRNFGQHNALLCGIRGHASTQS